MNTRPESTRPRFLISLALLLGLFAIVRMATLSAETPTLVGDGFDAALAPSDDPNAADSAKGSGSTTIDSNEKGKSSATLPTSASTSATDGEKAASTKPLVTINRSTPASVNDLRTIQAAIQQATEKGLPATVGVRINGTFRQRRDCDRRWIRAHGRPRGGSTRPRRHDHHARRQGTSKQKPWA